MARRAGLPDHARVGVQLAKAVPEVKFVGRHVPVGEQEDPGDPALEKLILHTLKKAAAVALPLHVAGNAEFINAVFGSLMPVPDMPHGQPDQAVTVKVSKGEGVPLTGQFRDIGIQLSGTAPVIR